MVFQSLKEHFSYSFTGSVRITSHVSVIDWLFIIDCLSHFFFNMNILDFLQRRRSKKKLKYEGKLCSMNC